MSNCEPHGFKTVSSERHVLLTKRSAPDRTNRIVYLSPRELNRGPSSNGRMGAYPADRPVRVR